MAQNPPTPGREAGHSSVRELAARALARLDNGESRARECVDETLRQHHLSREDQGLFQELVYGSLRTRAFIDYQLSRVSHRPLDQLAPWVRPLLRVAGHQILYLDRVPAAAAVDEATEIARVQGHEGVAKFVNGVLRELARLKLEDKLAPLPLDPAARLAISSSHPMWMAERLIDRYGYERAEAALAASNQAPLMTLRCNLSRLTREDLMTRLNQAGLKADACAYSPGGVYVTGAHDARRLPGYTENDFVVQDESSQVVTQLLGVAPGWNVADVCAAPGGKTLHLAELVGPEGRVYGFDRKSQAIDKLQTLTRRHHLDQVSLEPRDAQFPRPDLMGRLEGVLLDAPCSGLGVLRRRMEARWQVRPDTLRHQAERQLRMLIASAEYLVEGGVLLYAACTWIEEETEEIVDRFLAARPDFAFERAEKFLHRDLCSPEGYMRVLPGEFGMDGFFAARFRRTR